MSRDLTFLQPLCSDEWANPKLATPWSITIDGESWCGATNGHGMVLLRQPGVFGPYYKPEKVIALAHAAQSVTLTPIDLPALREWCRTRYDVTCEKCEGRGETSCDCPACGDQHLAPCPACNEREGRAGQQAGRLFGRTINRRLVEEWLAWVPDGEAVRFGSKPDPKEPAVFAGDDWFVLVMPLRPSGDYRTVEFAPRVSETVGGGSQESQP